LDKTSKILPQKNNREKSKQATTPQNPGNEVFQVIEQFFFHLAVYKLSSKQGSDTKAWNDRAPALWFLLHPANLNIVFS
jgi:hypothetical protein